MTKDILVIDDAMKPLMSALRAGRIMRNGAMSFSTFDHCPEQVCRCLTDRTKLLPNFMKARQIELAIFEHKCEYLHQSMPREFLVSMIAAFLGAMNIKGDNKRQLLAGMISVIENDPNIRWYDHRILPLSVYLACQDLLRTQKFDPKPAELLDACRVQNNEVISIHKFCIELCDYTRRCDAVVLQFATAEWAAPYLHDRALVHEMLGLHEILGTGDGLTDKHFLKLVAKAKKQLPPPTEIQKDRIR
jgi:hypothetical protein